MEDVARRLKEARSEADPQADQPQSGKALGVALRLSTEFVAAIVVGTGMGWGLDTLLGTFPWLTLVFFLIGAATGFRNVIRTANELNDAGNGKNSDGA